MVRDDKTKFLLYMEPELDKKSQIAINDEYTTLLRAAMVDAKKGTSNYKDPGLPDPVFNEGKTYWPMLGIPAGHTCSDGIKSTNYDLLLPGGYITNSLCVHYMMFFRSSITHNDWEKLKDLQRVYGRVQNQLQNNRFF